MSTKLDPWKPENKEQGSELIKALAAINIKADPFKKNFVESLLGQYASRGSLTENQWPYVRKFVEEDKGIQVAVNEKEDFDGGEIFSLFELGSMRLKNPTVTLPATKDTAEITWYRKTNGPILAKYKNGTFLASVDKLGKGFFSTYTKDRKPVQDIIKQFADDPVQYAALKGKEYVFCCFCRTELTNEISRFHGYGPICAENYGLPWIGPSAEGENK